MHLEFNLNSKSATGKSQNPLTLVEGVQAAHERQRGGAPVHTAHAEVLRGVVLERVRLLRRCRTMILASSNQAVI